MRRVKGFTLIELLVVIAIIAILATIVTYGVFHAQTEARDTVRKNDLTAISEGFIVRDQDKTCSANVNQYPDVSEGSTGLDASGGWIPVNQLDPAQDINGNKESNNCGNSNFIPEYLSRIPNDPQSSQGWTYLFSITSDKSHFRLAASLENSNSDVATACTTALNGWQLEGGPAKIAATTNGNMGVGNDCSSSNSSRGYNYIIGQ